MFVMSMLITVQCVEGWQVSDMCMLITVQCVEGWQVFDMGMLITVQCVWGVAGVLSCVCWLLWRGGRCMLSVC